jgi:hypothetical protein
VHVCNPRAHHQEDSCTKYMYIMTYVYMYDAPWYSRVRLCSGKGYLADNLAIIKSVSTISLFVHPFIILNSYLAVYLSIYMYVCMKVFLCRLYVCMMYVCERVSTYLLTHLTVTHLCEYMYLFIHLHI